MEKCRVVYLMPRDSAPDKKVNWDGLVDEVFKDEVDQFVIKSGVQGLYIRQKSDIRSRSQPSTSSSFTWLSPIIVPSLGLSHNQFPICLILFPFQIHLKHVKVNKKFLISLFYIVVYLIAAKYKCIDHIKQDI
jgi:hypothetical protein